MSKAILTIDDAPSIITPQIVDYLRSKGIVPIINFVGASIEEHFEKYKLAWNNGFTWDNIVTRIHNKKPEQGAYLLDENSMNIVLLHDNVDTNNNMDKYYEKIIDYVLSAGVEFVAPKFINMVK